MQLQLELVEAPKTFVQAWMWKVAARMTRLAMVPAAAAHSDSPAAAVVSDAVVDPDHHRSVRSLEETAAAVAANEAVDLAVADGTGMAPVLVVACLRMALAGPWTVAVAASAVEERMVAVVGEVGKAEAEREVMGSEKDLHSTGGRGAR